MGNDEQLDLGLDVEQTAWGKWVDPNRRAAQVQKFMDYAGLKRIPSKPWPKGSAEVKRLDPIVADLFPYNWSKSRNDFPIFSERARKTTAAMKPENADMTDAFVCFIGECFIKFAGAKWIEFEWFGRDASLYDNVNPALLLDTFDEDEITAWYLVLSMMDYHPEDHDGMFSEMAAAFREYAADHEEKRNEEKR